MGMWDDYVERGKTVEQQFASILSGAVFATIKQDIHEHWDVMDSMALKYDVKGMKKYRRSDDKPTDRLHWIELRNVNGKNGWLYGNADIIAFETRKWWLLVERKDLVQFVEGILDGWEEPIEKPEPYKLYQREGRQDLLTILPTVDLLSIASQVLVKK
jgi:hypothetical protein